MAAKNQVVILNELVERFAKKPYGWPEWETILLVAKLVKCGEISAIIDGAPVQAQDACAPFQKTGQWKTVKLIKKKIPTKEEVEKAQKLGKDLFGGIQPPGSEELKANIQSELNKWEKSLRAWSVLAETGNYPGGKEIASGIKLLDSLLRIKDTFEFITQVNQKRDDLLDLSDNMHDLTDFHGKQKPTWEKLRKALHEFDDNKEMLHSHPEAGSALTRMNEILRAPAPYGMLKDVEGLILKVKEANDALVEEKRKQALATVDEQIAHFDQHKDSALYDKVVSPLKTLKQKVAEEPSIPHISHYLATLNEMVEKGFKTISEVVDPKKPEKKTKPIKTLKLASLSDKPYLENESDINEFIDTLKENLLEAIKNDSLVKLL
jgi:hypothetical protein